MSTIYYTLQSSTAVLGVYCNSCDKLRSFAYTDDDSIVAYWTQNKEEILCPTCANNHKDKIFRKVKHSKDLPIKRSKYKFLDSWNHQMFKDDSKNKKTYPGYFCDED